MPPPPKPWENNPQGLSAAAVTTGTPTTAMPPTPARAGATATAPQQPATTAASVANRSLVGQNSMYGGSSYGGMGSSYGGMGGMGSSYGGMYGRSGMGYGSSMYGGMGGMYGGMGGMGGMYGGMGGMGGMYGGMGGMGGMHGGMMGEPSEFEQRSHMTFMLLGRVVELFGMFANVVQMVFGSVLNFMGSFVGLKQQYASINTVPANGLSPDQQQMLQGQQQGGVVQPDGSIAFGTGEGVQAGSQMQPNGNAVDPAFGVPRPFPQAPLIAPPPEPPSFLSLCSRLLRKVALLVVMYYISSRVLKFFASSKVPAPQHQHVPQPPGASWAPGPAGAATPGNVHHYAASSHAVPPSSFSPGYGAF